MNTLGYVEVVQVVALGNMDHSFIRESLATGEIELADVRAIITADPANQLVVSSVRMVRQHHIGPQPAVLNNLLPSTAYWCATVHGWRAG